MPGHRAERSRDRRVKIKEKTKNTASGRVIIVLHAGVSFFAGGDADAGGIGADAGRCP